MLLFIFEVDLCCELLLVLFSVVLLWWMLLFELKLLRIYLNCLLKLPIYVFYDTSFLLGELLMLSRLMVVAGGNVNLLAVEFFAELDYAVNPENFAVYYLSPADGVPYPLLLDVLPAILSFLLLELKRSWLILKVLFSGGLWILDYLEVGGSIWLPKSWTCDD